MRKLVAGVVVAGLMLAPELVTAQGAAPAAAPGTAATPAQVVATRQGGMAMVGSITDLMKAAVAAGADPKAYQEPAAALAKWGTAYPSLFPDGTQNVGDTKALPAIWSDPAGFEKADAAFVQASTALAEAAKSGDKAAFAAAFMDEGKACGGCHRNFKARN